MKIANQTEDSENFMQPVARVILIHFMIGYDHPFVDGNGRTARAVLPVDAAAGILDDRVPLDTQHPAQGAGAVRSRLPAHRVR